MHVDEAFAQLNSAFPKVARFQGKHFQYAERNGIVLIERKRTVLEETRFFYWLLVDGRFRLVHGSKESKLAPMRTIGQSFSPGIPYEEE